MVPYSQELLSLDTETSTEDEQNTGSRNKVTLLSQQLPDNPFSLILNQNRKSDAKDVSRDVIEQRIAQPGSTFVKEVLRFYLYTIKAVDDLYMCMPIYAQYRYTCTLFFAGRVR